jgi:hypothetical protein
MTLATHAVVGGAVASLFPSHPIIAFVVGFLSHFVLDAIPHWDYKLLSAYINPNKVDKNFGLDLLHVGTDMILGILITLLIWHPISVSQLEILFLGIFGGVLPDFLQFVYLRFPHQPMILIQKFHDFMHAKHELANRPLIGIFLQIILMICVVLLVKYLIQF